MYFRGHFRLYFCGSFSVSRSLFNKFSLRPHVFRMTDPNASRFQHDSDSGEEFPDNVSDNSSLSFDMNNVETREDISDNESTSSSASRPRSRSRSSSPVVPSSASSSRARRSRPAAARPRSRPSTSVRRPTVATVNHDTAPNTYNWEPYPSTDPYEAAKWLNDFEKRPGITVDSSGFSPLDYFSLFFDNDVISFLVRETNAYAHHVFATRGDTFYKQRWSDVDAVEMRAFLGLQIGKCMHSSYHQPSYVML